MPTTLRKLYPGVDLERVQAQVSAAMRRAFQECGTVVGFTARLNARLQAHGQPTITRQAVSWWASEGTLIDPAFWPHIEAITDLAVTRRHLRPDRYGFSS